MYRIGSGQRNIYSCQLIYKAVETLIKQGTSLDEMRVSDIARLSTVSRGTFYRHFDHVIDVVIWKSDRKTAQSCKRQLLMKNNRLFVSNYFEYWAKHSTFLDMLASINRLDIVLASLEKWISTVSPMLLTGTHLNSMHEQYLIRIWSVVIWSILCTWIYRNKQDDPEALTNMALHNLPDVHGEDVSNVFGFTVPAVKGELKFVTRANDIEYYTELGCTEIDWDDLPEELVDDCRNCDKHDGCKPVPMRYLNR